MNAPRFLRNISWFHSKMPLNRVKTRKFAGFVAKSTDNACFLFDAVTDGAILHRPAIPAAPNSSEPFRLLPSAQCERTQREDADFAFHAGFLADFAPKCRKFTQFREICAIPAQKPPSMRQSTHNLRGFAPPAAPAAVSHGKTSPGSRKNSKICQIPSPETLSTRNTVRHPASRSHRSARSGLARLS